MTTLAPEECRRYLSMLQELSGSYRFYDVHVHPYEVLFDRVTYQPDPTVPGVLSAAGRTYRPPPVGELKLAETPSRDPHSDRIRDISVMLLNRLYGSVGEPVLTDQMALGGVHQVLLLPVPPDSGSEAAFRNRMRWVRELYRDEGRFWVAGSVPATVGCGKIGEYVAEQRRQFDIKAVKCHPVASGIDLGSPPGREWLEALLAACRELELPLLLHGGRHNPYWESSRSDFGSLEHLKEIDFSQARQPVILAHAGLHRCGVQELSDEGLPVLQRMLERHPNLFIDISALRFDALRVVLRCIDAERILFGSDALYIPQWEAVVLTLHALRELGMKQERSFLQMASLNPAAVIFKE